VHRVDRPVLHEVEDHARVRFAPVAVLAIGLDRAVDVVGAVADVVDACAFAPELADHPAMQLAHGIFAE
jgi:hypothetical protein